MLYATTNATVNGQYVRCTFSIANQLDDQGQAASDVVQILDEFRLEVLKPGSFDVVATSPAVEGYDEATATQSITITDSSFNDRTARYNAVNTTLTHDVASLPMLEQLGLPINGDSLVIDFAAAGATITYKGTPIPLQTDSVVKQGFRGLTRLIETAIQKD